MKRAPVMMNVWNETLASFDNPPFIFFEWTDFDRMWFYLNQYPRQLAQALVDIGWPVIFIQAPSHNVETRDGWELEQVQFGIWRFPAWRHNSNQIKLNLAYLARWFPDSPWVFRHPNWIPLIGPYDFTGRFVAYDRRSFFIEHDPRPDLDIWERHLASISDMVLTNSVSGLIKWRRLNERTVYLPNPSPPIKHLDSHAQTRELDQIARPRLLVLNVLDSEFDVDLIEFVAAKRPDWSIVIIGSRPVEGARWPDKANIHYLGERLYAELQLYTRYCDVGLVPLKQQPRTLEISPLIVNDYRAADLPVVTTFLPELLQMSDSRIHVTNDRESFLSSIETALSPVDETQVSALTTESYTTWQQQAQQLVRLVNAEASLAEEKNSYEKIVARYHESLRVKSLEEQRNPLVMEELLTAAYANGRYNEVLELGDPSMPVYGCALIRLGKFDRARMWLEDYAVRTGNGDNNLLSNFDLANLHAYIYKLNGEFVEALQVLEDVEVMNPVHHLLAARIWFELGFRDNAAFFYGETVGEDPALLQAGDYLNIGDLMLHQGRLRDAEEAYLKASLLGMPQRSQQKLADLYEKTYTEPVTETRTE